MKFLRLLTTTALALLITGLALAQAPPPKAEQDALTATVSALDTKLFDAYNHCDLKTLGDMVSDDLEFYHDQTGLAVGKAPFLASIKQNICGKVERSLKPGSLEAHQLKNFGAVEIGEHWFHHPGHDDTEGVGMGKFVMIWQDKDGVWKLTRVISYDHESAQKS
ncbi:nuclear transport factor 2 family protein [Granulicella paludicola]|uniref:nuclear transport factor 2 family protein n=1 Tax=Granulicella paludicola TaxID=474951 RepID=UPI0021E03ABC|nr:nuclear transport factor 2 family protein [Granulicella paludicola]